MKTKVQALTKQVRNLLVDLGFIGLLFADIFAAQSVDPVTTPKLFVGPRTLKKIPGRLSTLESATDRCEDVANVIEGVVIENS